MQLRNIFLILFTLLVFSSCEKDADIKLPKVPKRMAVNCYITPGDSVIAWVSEVKSLFDGDISFDPKFIQDATVTISDGTNSTTLMLDAMTGNFYYSSAAAFSISQGTTYFLTVSAPGFPSLKASCTVPSANINDFNQHHTIIPEGNDTLMTVFYDWQDIQGQKNYYRVFASLLDSIDNLGLPFVNEYNFSFTREMYLDEGYENGKIATGKGEMYLNGGMDVISRYMRSHIITCEEHYYRYHLSISNYSGDNPFGEPSQLYTNVEGGLGVFGAYLVKTKTEKVF